VYFKLDEAELKLGWLLASLLVAGRMMSFNI